MCICWVYDTLNERSVWKEVYGRDLTLNSFSFPYSKAGNRNMSILSENRSYCYVNTFIFK